jgi:hypothetical protein
VFTFTTMADAARVVEAIDRLALASRRKVTRALASDALIRLRTHAMDT